MNALEQLADRAKNRFGDRVTIQELTYILDGFRIHLTTSTNRTKIGIGVTGGDIHWGKELLFPYDVVLNDIEKQADREKQALRFSETGILDGV